ncbi:membrane protein [Bacteroidia bacterium]|nr:membrane protein [Bacteroidia bacterium]
MILQTARREIERLCKNKIYWFCMIVAPLISLLFFISLMYNGLPTKLPAGLVDLDNSSPSRNLARQLDAFAGTKITAHYPSFEEARKSMQRGEIYGIFLIPGHFAQDVVVEKQPKISFYTNNSYLIAGSLLFRDMKTVANLASGSVVLQMGRARGYTNAQIIASIQPILIDTHPIGNPWLNYSVYLNNVILLGILSLLIMCVTVYSIGSEIKGKTAGEWLKTGNNSILQSLIGKLLPQTIIFFIVGLMMFAVLYLFMEFPVNGSIWNMILALLFFIFASQSLGVFMIGCFPTLRLGLSFACIWGMISFSISGFSYPVDAMYPAVQLMSNLFPLRHYFLIYVDQALNSRALFYSWPHYMALLAFGLLPIIVLRSLKWSLQYKSYQP